MSAGQGNQAINRVSSKGCFFWSVAAVSVRAPFVCLGLHICQSLVGTAPSWEPAPSSRTNNGLDGTNSFGGRIKITSCGALLRKHTLHWFCICTVMLVSDFISLKVWRALVGGVLNVECGVCSFISLIRYIYSNGIVAMGRGSSTALAI